MSCLAPCPIAGVLSRAPREGIAAMNSMRASSLGPESSSAVRRSTRRCRVSSSVSRSHGLLHFRIASPSNTHSKIAPEATVLSHAYCNQEATSQAHSGSSSSRRVTLCHAHGGGGSGSPSGGGPTSAASTSASAAGSAGAPRSFPYSLGRRVLLCHARHGSDGSSSSPSAASSASSAGALCSLPYGLDLASYPSMEGRNVLITGVGCGGGKCGKQERPGLILVCESACAVRS